MTILDFRFLINWLTRFGMSWKRFEMSEATSLCVLYKLLIIKNEIYWILIYLVRPIHKLPLIIIWCMSLYRWRCYALLYVTCIKKGHVYKQTLPLTNLPTTFFASAIISGIFMATLTNRNTELLVLHQSDHANSSLQ